METYLVSYSASSEYGTGINSTTMNFKKIKLLTHVQELEKTF